MRGSMIQHLTRSVKTRIDIVNFSIEGAENLFSKYLVIVVENKNLIVKVCIENER